MSFLLALLLLQATSSSLPEARLTTPPLRLSVERSRWCGNRASITFSVTNTGETEQTFFVSPCEELRDGIFRWKGTYSLFVGELGSARSVDCSATHGATCVAEREKVILKARGQRMWQLTNVAFSKANRRQTAALSVAFRQEVSEPDQPAVRLSWSGSLKISRIGATNCWQLAAVEPGVADGSAPRLRSDADR